MDSLGGSYTALTSTLEIPMKSLIAALSVVVFFILTVLAGSVGLEYRRHWERALDPHGPYILIDIPKGQHFSATTTQLYRSGLIDRPVLFRLAARITAMDHAVKAGEYRLSAAMSPKAILAKLASGEVALHSLVIPEGYTLEQIAQVIAQSGISDAAAFRKAATDPAVCARFDIPAQSLEGYLFPDTYFFPKATPAMAILQAMIQRFRSKLTPAMLDQARHLGMSLHEVVTLASMIEKETGVDAERNLVSSVFHNRLKKGMRLESDPTAVYGIFNQRGLITREHLQTSTPYNTYRISGLPKGPIANPGLAAIHAALYPAQTDYLYFVARDDRNHRFSRTWAEHEQAVEAYRSFRK
jgi:UPF0755 protein